MANATGGIIVRTTATATTPKLTSGFTAVTETITGIVCDRIVEATKRAKGKSLYENMKANAAVAARAGAATGAKIRGGACRRGEPPPKAACAVPPSPHAASSVSGGTRRKYSVRNQTVNGRVKVEWIKISALYRSSRPSRLMIREY